VSNTIWYHFDGPRAQWWACAGEDPIAFPSPIVCELEQPLGAAGEQLPVAAPAALAERRGRRGWGDALGGRSKSNKIPMLLTAAATAAPAGQLLAAATDSSPAGHLPPDMPERLRLEVWLSPAAAPADDAAERPERGLFPLPTGRHIPARPFPLPRGSSSAFPLLADDAAGFPTDPTRRWIGGECLHVEVSRPFNVDFPGGETWFSVEQTNPQQLQTYLSHPGSTLNQNHTEELNYWYSLRAVGLAAEGGEAAHTKLATAAEKIGRLDDMGATGGSWTDSPRQERFTHIIHRVNGSRDWIRTCSNCGLKTHFHLGRAHKGQKCPADIKDSIGNVLLYMYSETCDDEVIRAVHEKKLWPQRAPQWPMWLPSQSAPSVPSSRPLAPESSCFWTS